MVANSIDQTIHSLIMRKGAMADALVDRTLDIKNEKILNYLLTGEGDIG